MSNPLLSLTKENFWNELYEKYPHEMKAFCSWIDEYKNRVDWKELFNEDRFDCFSKAPKFHHLPIGMQIGIFIQYCMETPHRYQFIEGLPVNMEGMAVMIKTFFDQEHKFFNKPEPVLYPTPDEIVNKVIHDNPHDPESFSDIKLQR